MRKTPGQFAAPRRGVLVWGAALLLVCATGSLGAQKRPSSGQDVAPPERTVSVFALPQLQAQYNQLQLAIARALAQKEPAEAERHCRRALQLFPSDGRLHYQLACALAGQGKVDEAFDNLEMAVQRGADVAKWSSKEPWLAALRGHDRFAALVQLSGKAAAAPAWQQSIRPGIIRGGEALVTEQNTAYDPRRGVFLTFFAFPRDEGQQTKESPPGPSAARPAGSDQAAAGGKDPLVAASVPTLFGAAPDNGQPAWVGRGQPPVVKEHGQVGRLLNQWFHEGTAAGNHGDLYDNHDADHSNLHCWQLPQLTRIEFGASARRYQVHRGLQIQFFYNGITIGNASMAKVNGPYWRSLPRLAYTSPRAMSILYSQYITNHLYVYPEHRDHDPGHNGQGGGYGDVYCANTPYVIISQGSSGSDRQFLDAVACTLAAFRPEVKQLLASRGALMPTVQMILRMCNRQVRSEADYLSGKAHPTVFDGQQLDPLKMIQLAHQIEPDEVPPIARVRVVAEDLGQVGRDYFDVGPRERLFDTPCAIARVVRSVAYQRRMVISAEASSDLNQRPLTWHWVVLRGDAERIRIRPLNRQASVAELLVPYHRRRPVWPGSDMASNRVDIGVFVHNGRYYSAPAFISLFYLDNEQRVYDEQHRIESVQYTTPADGGNYVDPAIDLPKSWRDEYHYDRRGRLIGWTRTRAGRTQQFTADGALVLQEDEQGRPTEARTVRYVAHQDGKRPPTLVQEMGDELLRYSYASPEDRLGRIVQRIPVETEERSAPAEAHQPGS